MACSTTGKWALPTFRFAFSIPPRTPSSPHKPRTRTGTTCSRTSCRVITTSRSRRQRATSAAPAGHLVRGRLKGLPRQARTRMSMVTTTAPKSRPRSSAVGPSHWPVPRNRPGKPMSGRKPTTPPMPTATSRWTSASSGRCRWGTLSGGTRTTAGRSMPPMASHRGSPGSRSTCTSTPTTTAPRIPPRPTPRRRRTPTGRTSSRGWLRTRSSSRSTARRCLPGSGSAVPASTVA